MLNNLATSALLLWSTFDGLATASILPRANIDSFINGERNAALKGVLANVGPDGKLATNASRGVVIAAPGVVNPDYRYSWTRDSALTMHAIEEEFFLGNQALGSTLGDYIYAEANRQTVYNPMGPLYPWGTGLGEAKFQINLTRYNGVWGRPQRDGPALRAITLMNYVNYLIEHGHTQSANDVVWPIISNDLNYVAQYWNQTGYDLWEEVSGSSFFTIVAQHRALVQGQHIAHRLNQKCDGCVQQQSQIACFIANNFWNETGGYIRSNINGGSYRSGIDADSLLGSIEIFDIRGSCDTDSYQPCSSRVLSNHKVYVDAFRSIYTLNENYSSSSGVATGRYPEDSYYGGNPWYLCTLAAAEVLYDAAAQFRHQGQLTIDDVSLAFFQQFYGSAKVGTYSAPTSAGAAGTWGVSSFGQTSWGSPAKFAETNEFTKILTAMTTYADGFVKVVQSFTPSNGSLSEQYNRDTGAQLSAWDLTWSFASFLTMSQRRAGQYPPSWNSGVNRGIAKVCEASSTVGNYTPALMAGAPTVDMSCQIQVTFNVYATTSFGTNIYVAGNSSSLNYYAVASNPMAASGYPIWNYIVQLPPSSTINYKYLYQESASYVLEWTNRTLVTPACGDGRVQIATNDTIGTANITITQDFCNPDVTHCW